MNFEFKKSAKRILAIALAIAMVCAILTGCTPETPITHEHTYDNAWSSDETNHWHKATCEHVGEKKDEAAHQFGADGNCTVCKYHVHVYSSAWTFNGTTHWHAATCGHNVKSAEAKHTLNADGTKCSVCGMEVVEHARKPVSTEPFKCSYEIGNVRVQLLSDTLIRIEDKTDKGFENRESWIVTNRLEWEGVNGEKITENGATKLVTDKYTVVVPNGGAAKDVYVTSPSGETVWRFTGMTDTNVYIPSPSDELTSWHFTDSPRIIPSYEGYSVTENEDPLQGWDFDNDATDIFVFIPQGDYTQFCTDYVSLTGKTEMVDLSTLGFWDSRYYKYTADTALQQIKDYRDRGYALDVLVIDTDWRVSTGDTSGMGYEINTSLFPDMAEFLKQCKALGVEVCFNDHPTPVKGTNNGLDKEEVGYRNEKLTLILSLGVDYWWYDRNWSTSLNSVNPEISVYAFGMYAYQWITEDYFNSIADIHEYARRAVIMGNVDGVLNGEWKYASDLSAHRYSIQWTGDTYSGSKDLAQEIYTAVLGGAEVGLPYVSADLGGHNGGLSDALYIRWIQYGLLSSIARVHCVNSQPGRMPWLYGETAEEVFKVYQDMRYRLLPLYYDLARENYDAGLPIIRRVDVNYPQYVEASRNDEYLLGDYILIAPLSETDSAPLDSHKVKPSTLFTHDEDGKEVTGLLGSYVDSLSVSAKPKATRTDLDINFNWGTGKAHESMNNVDGFSVKWTGYINIGSIPAKLAFIADDSVRVTIDGKIAVTGNDATKFYTTDLLSANSKHEIVITYQDLSGEAFIYSYYIEQPVESACYTSREVFFPEGTWIDVWSGKRYVGPATYGVSYPLETSPVFVREGALVVLAQNGENANAADWSEMTLDVYPSVNFNAHTRLYEDDTRTVAYRDGKYRTTDISMSYDNVKNALVVTINAAQGQFSGDRACLDRVWNVRVHMNPEWEALSSAVLNGSAIPSDSIGHFKQSDSAYPFAAKGSALDGDVYQFTVSGSVTQAYTLELYFGVTVNSQINENYDATETEFTLTAAGSVNSVNLSQEGTIDWLSFGDDGTANAVGNSKNVFSYPQTRTVGSGDPAEATSVSIAGCSGVVNKSYLNDGKTVNSSGAVFTNQFFKFEINTAGKNAQYVLILGGSYSTAKVTVRDRAGNVKTVYFGNIDGEWTQKIVIECPQTSYGTLYVDFAAVATSKRDGGGYPNEAKLVSEQVLKLYGCYAAEK